MRNYLKKTFGINVIQYRQFMQCRNSVLHVNTSAMGKSTENVNLLHLRSLSLCHVPTEINERISVSKSAEEISSCLATI